MFTSLFMNTLLCMSLTCLIIKHKLELKFNWFVKQTNIISFFLKSQARVVHKQLILFTTLFKIYYLTCYKD